MNRGLLGYPENYKPLVTTPPGLPFGLPSPVYYSQGTLTTITGAAGANTESAWAQVLPAAGITADGFWLFVNYPAITADFLYDIGVGGAGSEVVLVENILVNATPLGLVAPYSVYIPLLIPAGARVAARCQSSDAAASPSLDIQLVKGGVHAAMRCRRATTYGANTADSGGVSIDPGGTINTKGAWTELAPAVEYPIDYMVVGIGGQNNGARTTMDHLVDIGFGPAGAEQVAVANIHVRQLTGGNALFPSVHMRWPTRVPAGQRLVARQSSTNSDATDRLIDVSVVGFTA